MTAPAQQTPPQGVTAGQVATYALGAAATAKTIQLAIRAALLRDVVKLWPALDKSRLNETWPGWLRAMSLLITNYHGQSSFAAGRSYQAMRAQALQSPTPSRLIKLAAPPSQEWLDRALGFSGPGMLEKDTAQPGTALSTTLGTAARIALDGGRTTLIDTTRHDPAAIGWYRVTDGHPCAFCAMLASRVAYKGRGSLYRSERTASFQAHNDCGCVAAPLFSHDQQLPELNERAAELYGSATGGESGGAALKAFRKAWEQQNPAT